MAIEPIHLAAARTAVSLAGTVSRAVTSATEGAASSAKQSFAAVLAGSPPNDLGGPTPAGAQKPSVTEQLADRIKKLIRGAGIDLIAPLRLGLGTDNALVVDAMHPQREMIEIAIAHDQTIEHVLADWQNGNQSAGHREPLELVIEPMPPGNRPF